MSYLYPFDDANEEAPGAVAEGLEEDGRVVIVVTPESQ